jgi:hypothetical protein
MGVAIGSIIQNPNIGGRFGAVLLGKRCGYWTFILD